MFFDIVTNTLESAFKLCTTAFFKKENTSYFTVQNNLICSSFQQKEVKREVTITEINN